MSARYELLCQVQLLHDYFDRSLARELMLVPTPDTRALLVDARLHYKQVRERGLIIARVDAGRKLFTRLPAGMCMRFYLRPNVPWFTTVTNVDCALLRDRRFYFTNLSAAIEGSDFASHALSASVDLFEHARSYTPGNLARVGGVVYECLANSLGEPPAESASVWASLDAPAVASSQDLVNVFGSSASFRTSSEAKEFRVQIFGADLHSKRFTHLVADSSLRFAQSTRDVQIDMSHLRPGRYRVELNGESFDGYFDPSLRAFGALGVVELFDVPAGDPFSFFAEDGALRSGLAMSIRFAGRRAHWKYYTPGHKVRDIGIEHDENAHPFERMPASASAEATEYFVSKQPMPIRERSDEHAFELRLGSNEVRRAPLPDPSLPTLLTQATDGSNASFFNIRLHH